MRLFFSAGEASGDAYAAALLKKLSAKHGIEASALGGRQVRQAGAELVADSSSWGAIGIWESLKVYPKARRGLAKAKRELSNGRPGVFVPIDYGYLNIGLARFAKGKGWKVVYFSPPGAWRKDRQGADLPKVTDAIITPFSWSAEILNRMGANAHWFGHPIKQMIREGTRDRGTEGPGVQETQARVNPQSTVHNPQSTIAILPGSRQSEIELLLPVFAKAVESFSERAQIAVAPSLDIEMVKSKWRGLAPKREDVFIVGDMYGILRRARAAIVCSGTATLEAALCGCPHVVAYKVSKMVELQARLIRFKVPHIAQPNILLERQVVKEFIQHAATPEAIGGELRRLLDDESARSAQLEAFAELDELLGPDDAIGRSVELIAAFLAERTT